MIFQEYTHDIPTCVVLVTFSGDILSCEDIRRRGPALWFGAWLYKKYVCFYGPKHWVSNISPVDVSINYHSSCYRYDGSDRSLSNRLWNDGELIYQQILKFDRAWRDVQRIILGQMTSHYQKCISAALLQHLYRPFIFHHSCEWFMRRCMIYKYASSNMSFLYSTSQNSLPLIELLNW